ncbi:MAG: hypothetical protein MPW17_16095 [Candidatus Manganitrophus sp.]|nr:hypothetical protein [Candidatus Manganitrophus sp.]WDT70268.1 MAG: hypothetical protein MPW17_16095 [Candidatus Manganitrophus sp.]
MTGFVGVLFFSLYRSSPDQIASAPAAPSPVIATRPDPIDSPASAVEENIEAKESALPPEEEIAPPLSTAAQPVSPEPSAPEQAAVGEAIKTPPPDGKPEQNQIKKTTVLSASKSVPSSTPMSPPPVSPPDASPAAAKISPKLREGLPPQPKVEEIPAGAKSNEELLHELIERQRRAYQSQNWALSRQDVADGSAFEGQIAELFGGAEPIRVEFQIFGLKVRGDEADLSLMQTARLRKEKGVSLQKSLLFWKLKKEKERWKIEKFNVIEKYPPIEVG